jgi:hypothetical protein
VFPEPPTPGPLVSEVALAGPTSTAAQIDRRWIAAHTGIPRLKQVEKALGLWISSRSYR